MRRLVSPAFTPRSIERLRPRIAAIVDAALDGLDDDIDLIADFAYIVPLAVIAELLDVGAEGAELFREQTPALVKMLEIDATAADLADSVDASMQIMLGLAPLIAERRQHPGDDFISALLEQAEITLEEVMSTCVLLLAAGHETTANLIGNGARVLALQPELQRHLFDDPSRAIEELLRVETPVKRAVRTATTEHELNGHRVAEGEPVALLLDAANVDARRFPDAGVLDLARNPQGHLAYGAGPHFCLGAALARVEAAEALTRLFDRYERLELAGDGEQWRHSNTFHGLTRLPVRLR
jgi:cytochrome P450